ncbi:MAG: extracellular solute-binding protein [Actinomycetota bacterium]
MRHMSRRLAIAAAFALVVGACSFGTETPGTQAPTGSGTETGMAPVNLTIWSHRSDAFNGAIEQAATAYTAVHPEVTFTFEDFAYNQYIQTLQTALPAGTGPDILQMFGTWTCSYSGFLAPVPQDVMTTEAAHEAFYAAPIGGYTCDDTLYGFPHEFNIEYGATLVNTDVADAAGVDWEAGWATWDDFRADALAMTETIDGNITRAGYHFTAADGLSYSFFSLLVQSGGAMLNEDATAFTFDTAEGREAFAILQAMVDDGIIDPVLFNDEENWVGDCYFEDLCSMGLVGPWVVRDYEESAPDIAAATTYVALPPNEGSSAFVADSGWGMTVSKDSPAAEAAWDFIAFATIDPENAAAFNLTSGSLPALVANGEGAGRDALVAEFPHFAPFFEILPDGQYVGNLPDRDLVWYDIAYPHLLAGLQGVESVDDMLAAMQREANETFG